MKFSGLNNRGLAKKKEVSFSVDISLSNTTGIAEFGLSGEGGIPLRLHFESGAIYDRPYPNTSDGDYVSSYYPEDVLSVSGNLSGSSTTSFYNYDINGDPATLIGEGPGTGISRFFANTTGVDLYANLNVATDPVDHSVYFPDYFREREYYTGALYNDDEESDIIIYSGYVKDPTGLSDGTSWSLYSHDTNIEAGTSGLLVLDTSGGKINRFYDVNLILYTNLGQVNKRFNTSGEISDEYSYMLDSAGFEDDFKDSNNSLALVSGEEPAATKTGTYFTNYSTYQNQVAYSGADFNISLRYVDGHTGDLFTGENGLGILGYGLGDDYLSGSGYLEGSGYISSGTEMVNWVSGTDTVDGSLTSGLGITGHIDTTGSFYFYATGEGSYSFSMGGTGYSALSGDGGLSGTRVLTTGTIAGMVSGTGIGGVTPYTGSYGEEYGQRLFSGEVTGEPSLPYSLDYPLSGLQDISGHSGILAEYMIASGVMIGDDSLMVSGLGDYSGILTGYEKSFTGTWDLETGYVSGGDIQPLESYRDAGNLSGAGGINAGYTKTKSISPMPITNFVSRVTDKNMFDNESMTVSLDISGILTGYEEILITGVK